MSVGYDVFLIVYFLAGTVRSVQVVVLRRLASRDLRRVVEQAFSGHRDAVVEYRGVAGAFTTSPRKGCSQ